MNWQNKEEFSKSLGSELQSIKNRVRYLIGDANWGEDGRYKEAILTNLLSRFLPKNISIGTGFVISSDKDGITDCTDQIDIIIYDNSFPVFFKEGGFVILQPDSVRGIIEVKTKIHNKKKFNGALEKTLKNVDIIKNNMIDHNSSVLHFFNGIFSYESDFKLNTLFERVEDFYNEKKGNTEDFLRYFPCICFDKDLISFVYSHEYRFCKSDDTATFWFISLILRTLNSKTDETFWSDYRDIDKYKKCSFHL